MRSFLRNQCVLAGLSTAMGAAALYGQGGVHSGDIAYAVATANNQVYVGGQVVGAIPGQTAFGDNDGFIQAYTPNGKHLWSAQFGTSARDVVNGVAADATGVYAAGLTEGAFPGQSFGGTSDAFVVKYDLNGTQLWLHQFGNGGVDRVQAVASDGTYLYVTGYTGGSLQGQTNLGAQDCFIQKWDQVGHLLWTKQFGTAGTDRAYGIVANGNGIFVAGRTDGALAGDFSQGGLDGFLVAFNPDGDQMWGTQFGTTYDERGWGIGADATGVYVTGRTEGVFPGQDYKGDDDAYFAKFDYSGVQQWVTEFGTRRFDRGTAVSTDSTGAYDVGYTQGTLAGQTSSGYVDVFVKKYDVNGKLLWTRQFGSDQFDAGWGTATDSSGVYIAGTAGGQLPGQSGTPKTSGFFLEKLDTDGNLLWVNEISVPHGNGGSGS